MCNRSCWCSLSLSLSQYSIYPVTADAIVNWGANGAIPRATRSESKWAHSVWMRLHHPPNGPAKSDYTLQPYIIYGFAAAAAAALYSVLYIYMYRHILNIVRPHYKSRLDDPSPPGRACFTKQHQYVFIYTHSSLAFNGKRNWAMNGAYWWATRTAARDFSWLIAKFDDVYNHLKRHTLYYIAYYLQYIYINLNVYVYYIDFYIYAALFDCLFEIPRCCVVSPLLLLYDEGGSKSFDRWYNISRAERLSGLCIL